MKAEERVGGFTPQQTKQFNKFNNYSKLWDLCEFPQVDRKNSFSGGSEQ